MDIPPLIVLGGGFGTRLRSVVSDLPKPLAPVEERPFLHLLLQSWIAQGAHRFVFALHHKANLIRRYLETEQANGSLRGCDVAVVVEAEPLGTGGAVAQAVRTCGLDGEVLVANADTWLEGGLQPLAVASAPAVAVVKVPNVGRFGAVEIQDDRITGFAEKSGVAGSGWINAGLYKMRTGDFAHWDGLPFSIERDFFPSLAAAGELTSVPVDGRFIDVGVPEDYFQFCDWVRRGELGAI